MKLLDMLSFNAAPKADAASAQSARQPLAGTIFQNVLQKENGSLSASENGGETSSGSQLEQLLQELENWLSQKTDGALDEESLSSLPPHGGVTASEEELAAVEQLLHKIKTLLENTGETDEAEAALPGEEKPETIELKLPDSHVLHQVQHLLTQIIQDNQPSQKAALVADIVEKAPEFLAILQSKPGSEELVGKLKRQFFTTDPAQSKVLSMSSAELKGLKSIMEQMMSANSETGQKDWKLAESELKAMLMGKKTDAPQADQRLSFMVKAKDVQADEKAVIRDQPVHSNGLLSSQHRTSQTLLQGLQMTQTADEASQSQPKSVSEQILSSWKQMKFTPFGRSTGSFTIRLNPENLGFITIKLVKQHGMFSSKIIASTDSAKELLEHNLSHLKQALPNMSVHIDRFAVAHQSADQTFGQPADDQKGQQQQKQDQQKSQDNEDFREFLDELIETPSQDNEEEI
ncbi:MULTISPECIES: flagellar hook-length control protein FliK [Bacillus]|uniref:flagellar hook-length control protein FliK n=1 Tax=Bacillus TaxID=1386 RepID=UPI0003FCB9A4|nr:MULTISPECIES: flagellar hook-length control protein FliK [Bacillus]QHZ46804.1 flagellar hook-length control protein FliK [Bacillus sp. NSP9.1]